VKLWNWTFVPAHKATQSLEIKRNGLGADGGIHKLRTNYRETLSELGSCFVIYDAIAMEFHCRIHEITKIDMWFLKQYEELYVLEKEIST
jgi:carbamoyl-phosphate synthase large subunit